MSVTLVRPLLTVHFEKQAGDAVNDRRGRRVGEWGGGCRTHRQEDPVEKERKKTRHTREKEKLALSGTLDDTDVCAYIHTYVDLCMAYNAHHGYVSLLSIVAHFTDGADCVGGGATV